MGKTHADRQKVDQNEEDVFNSSGKRGKLAGRNVPCISESNIWNLVKGGKPRTLILNLIQSEACEKWFQELFLKQSQGPRIRIPIPKHLVSFDEKYLRRCLELIQMNASKGAPCALSANSNSIDREFMADYVVVARGNSMDATKYAIDYPVDVGGGDLTISSIDESIVGSIMGSPSMISILRSPLFQRLGISDHDASFGGIGLFENKRCAPSDYHSSPASLTCSPQKTGKDTLVLRNKGFRSGSVQRSGMPVSSGQLAHTDQSSVSSLSPSDSQGMLHCTWDSGIPHFSFSLDDQKELYVAHAWKVEANNDMAMDFVYSFHLKPSGQRIFDISDNESDLIGKMKVSTSFSLSSNNSRIMETEFVMVDANGNHARDMRTMSRHSRRSRKLSKVMELFKTSHSIKQRTLSLFDGTTTIPEDFSAEKDLEACGHLDQQCRPDVLEKDFLPNLEMAAIVVKDHIHDAGQKKEEVGGWGLKFLKKRVGMKQKVASLDAPAPPECCLRNVGDCSTGIDIIVPAGPHGGPRTKNGGPSSLIERWKLGGQCDCGGWDVGCPLKVLKAKPRIEEGLTSSEARGDCKSFELFIEGSKQEMATLKMVNIHDGLYFISFQPSALSALQCFSIAVAIIHSQSPTLRPKHVQD